MRRRGLCSFYIRFGHSTFLLCYSINHSYCTHHSVHTLCRIYSAMAYIFRGTGLGCLLGVSSTTRKPKAGPSWWLRSQTYDMSLKLESARIPPNVRSKDNHLDRIRDGVLSKESLSNVSTRSDDTQNSLKKCEKADRELGWDGPDDPEVDRPTPTLFWYSN